MKAVVYTRYGPPDVLRFTDVEPPVPKSPIAVKRRFGVPQTGAVRNCRPALG